MQRNCLIKKNNNKINIVLWHDKYSVMKTIPPCNKICRVSRRKGMIKCLKMYGLTLESVV